MLILVANLGSTSFKYKLIETTPSHEFEHVVAEGSADRIGLGDSKWKLAAETETFTGTRDLDTHADAIELHLRQLIDSESIASLKDIQAIGFKAVHGGPISGAVVVDDHVIETMEQFSDVAPAHNPPYIAAMRAFKESLPDVPQVAAFETSFHQTIPLARQVYGIPYEWTEEYGIRRYGFHGASHRYIGYRMQKVLPEAKRVISCHLGGSCSVCAIEDGQSVANSFGMTAQSGLPHSARVGDFDCFALLKLLKEGLDVETIFKKLGKEGGMAGISGVSSDMREVEQAAGRGNSRAQLAIDALVDSTRQYIGAHMAVLGGVDALVFTGGIGQHARFIREAICANFEYAGLKLDEIRNRSITGASEEMINTFDSEKTIWVVPTNEELIVARQTQDVLKPQDSADQA